MLLLVRLVFIFHVEVSRDVDVHVALDADF